jgi:hypothetical protein
MVMPGQFLERPTLIVREVPGAETLSLEGLFHRGRQAPAVVICAPHPRMGGSMDSPVVSELAWALTQSKRATLRFNYQGVGASPGTIQANPPRGEGPAKLETVGSEADDARAGVNLLRASVDHRRVAIAGYSFGAAVALSVALSDPTITDVVLISPPTNLFDFSGMTQVTKPLLVVAGHLDPWVDRPRVAEWTQAATDARWEVVAGADHTFSRGLTELGKVVVGWFDSRARESLGA